MTKYRAFLLDPPSPLAIVLTKLPVSQMFFHHPISNYDDPVHTAGSAVGMGAPYPQRVQSISLMSLNRVTFANLAKLN